MYTWLLSFLLIAATSKTLSAPSDFRELGAVLRMIDPVSEQVVLIEGEPVYLGLYFPRFIGVAPVIAFAGNSKLGFFHMEFSSPSFFVDARTKNNVAANAGFLLELSPDRQNGWYGSSGTNKIDSALLWDVNIIGRPDQLKTPVNGAYLSIDGLLKQVRENAGLTHIPQGTLQGLLGNAQGLKSTMASAQYFEALQGEDYAKFKKSWDFKKVISPGDIKLRYAVKINQTIFIFETEQGRSVSELDCSAFGEDGKVRTVFENKQSKNRIVPSVQPGPPFYYEDINFEYEGSMYGITIPLSEEKVPTVLIDGVLQKEVTLVSKPGDDISILPNTLKEAGFNEKRYAHATCNFLRAK